MEKIEHVVEEKSQGKGEMEKDQPSKHSKMNSQKDIESHLKETFRKSLVVAVVLSVVLGSVAGSVFGFMAGKYGTSGIKGLVQDLKKGAVGTSEDSSEKTKVNLVEEDSAVVSSVDKVSPSVVSIVITKDVPKMDNQINDPFYNDPFFNPFGFQQRRQLPPSSGETEKQEIGGGSGFIIDADGYIMTNRHVVEDSEAEYTVVMNDGKKVDASVLAIDPVNDLAILKINEKNLPAVELGDSDNLKIGQTVIAIGNSLGEFRNTVSKGIISGLKRNVSAGDGNGQSELLQEVIQTDAAINPGNSGGPLLNIEGQVIGINVAMAEGAENIGFAIPVNQIKKVFQGVKTNGKIVRPYLGIRYLMINDQIQKENNLKYNYGALVIRGEKMSDLAVIPGSPADKAGIKENDIILEIDGKKIDENNDLSSTIRNKNVGDEVTLKVLSGGEEKIVKIKLEEASS